MERSPNGGEIFLYVRDDIPSRLITEYNILEDIERIFVKLNARNRKCLLCSSYNPHKNNICNYLHNLSRGLDLYLCHYDNLLVLGDLKCET